MAIFIKVFQFFLAIALLVLSSQWRSPFLAPWRSNLFWGYLGISGLLIVAAWQGLKIRNTVAKSLNSGTLLIAIAGCIILLLGEFKFQGIKHDILTGNPEQVKRLGQHFIVGYRDFNEVKQLVEKQAIGGVFVTYHNIKEKTKADIQLEIKTLQDIRKRQGLPPLWIATDQEGGIVSRLSPPLSQLPALSEIVTKQSDAASRNKAVTEYAQIQGNELYQLGVNVNFSPVIDLNYNIINPHDRLSKIYQRAISDDKNIVAEVANTYCQTLARTGVRCTIKHFPGLGRLQNDTHLESARLETPITELDQEDWVPFKKVSQNSKVWMMLGHAILTEVDHDRPVSFSKAVVKNILRNRWQYDGILITDDFCMYAVYHSREGVEKASLAALNAGVDLILISYDSDLYYPAMNFLLKADQSEKLDRLLIAQSHARLEGERKELNFSRFK